MMQVQQFNSQNLNAGGLPMNASAFVGNLSMMGVSPMGSIAGANMWRQMAASLTCGGCQRIFQQPHTLYCGHHLCANCIDVVKNSGHATFRCPHRDCDKNISTKNPGVINALLNEIIQQTQRLCQVTPDGLAFQQQTQQMLPQQQPQQRNVNVNQHPGNSFGFETKTKSDFNENTTTSGVSMPIMNLLNMNGGPMPMQQQNHQTQQGRPNQQHPQQSQLQQQQHQQQHHHQHQQHNGRGMTQQPQPGNPMQGGIVPPPLTAVGGGFNAVVWGGNAGNAGNAAAELSPSSNTPNATQDGDKDRLVLSPNQRKYIRYVVVVDPVTNAKYTVGIKHVLSTKGAQDLVAQLEKNINSEYKKGSCKAACTSVQPGMTCPMGRECAYVHVTPEGWKQRRRFSSANEKRKDAANAIAGTSPNGFPGGNGSGSEHLDQSQSQNTDSNSNTPPEPSFGLFGIGGLGDNTLLTGTASVGSSHMPAFPASLQAAFPSSLSPASSTPSASSNSNMLGPMLGGGRLFNTTAQQQPLLGGDLNATQSAPDYFRGAPDGGSSDIGGLGMLSLPQPSGQDYFPDDFWKNLDLNINTSTEGGASGTR